MQQRKHKTKQNKKQSITDLWDNFRQPNRSVSRIPKMGEAEKVFEGNNSQKLFKVDEKYKSTDPKSSTNPKYKKHEI